MSSSTSSHVSPLPYDPTRPVGESTTTYQGSFLFDSVTSAMAKFSPTALYSIIKREDSAEQARRQTMMTQMDWSSCPTVSSTHSQAESNYAYGNTRYDQETMPLPCDIDYKHGLPIDDNVYDNDTAPIRSQHSYVDYHPYGSIIITHQISPLQDSLLNSTPTIFPPSIQPETIYPQEYVYGSYPSSRVQQTPPPAFPPQEISRPESPQIKIEPVEENAYSYHYFIPSYAPEPQAMGILESIESDDVERRYPLEPIEHIKREWVEYYSDSSASSTASTFASTNSHCSTSSSMTSYDAHDVTGRSLKLEEGQY
ncbi:hypothetical protein F4679DRAFT_579483 [Xylaria curta]|nr:hypothetical protein F4679DRAFT_579483 [Xylaria curta]